MSKKWHQKATVQAAMIGAVVAGVIALVAGAVTTYIAARATRPPTVTSVAVFGDVPQAFSTLTAVSAGSSVFAAPATADPTEAGAQLQFKSETIISDLQCISSGTQGVGPNHNVVITARTGPCGAQQDTPFACTIMGSTEPNQSCSSSDRLTIKAGECADFRIETQREVESRTYVNCTVRFSRITEVTRQ